MCGQRLTEGRLVDWRYYFSTQSVSAKRCCLKTTTILAHAHSLPSIHMGENVRCNDDSIETFTWARGNYDTTSEQHG